MATIDGKEVKVGTVLFYELELARVERLTATQAACVHLNEALQPVQHLTFKAKLDTQSRSYRGMIDKGGLEIGTGGGWHQKHWRVAKDPKAVLEKKAAKNAERKANADERERKNQERIAAQYQDVLIGYQERTCINQALGLWAMSINHKSGPVSVIWTAEHRTIYGRGDEEYDGVTLSFTIYDKDRHGNVGGRHSSAYGLTELEVLASLRYGGD